MDMTPEEFFIEQKRYIREKEDQWEYDREILAMIYNTSTKTKRSISGRELIEIEKDRKQVKYEWDDDLIRKALRAWQ